MKKSHERRLKALLLAMLVGLAVPVLDVPAQLARVYARLAQEAGIGSVRGLPDTGNFAADAQSCDAALPANGRSHRFGNVAAAHWNTLSSRLFVSNEHAYPMVLIVTDPQGEVEYQAIALHPGRGGQLQVPVGDYGLVALTGRSWCNLAQGFVDGVEVMARQDMTIQSGQVAKLRLMPYGDAPESAGPRIDGHGSLVLQRMGRHYAVDGTVNEIPLTFMVDTGASITTVTKEFAAQAGLRNCVPHQVSTANGIATACQATARELTLG